jgi:hypothetical protein
MSNAQPDSPVGMPYSSVGAWIEERTFQSAVSERYVYRACAPAGVVHSPLRSE